MAISRTEVWQDPEHPSWYQLSAGLQPLAAQVSGRQDLVVAIKPTAEAEARVARYVPELGEVQVAADALMDPRSVDPRRIDLSVADTRIDHAALIGVVTARAALAGTTLGPLPEDTTEEVRRWAEVLDSARALGALLRHFPGHRTWLRAALAVSCPLATVGSPTPGIATSVWQVAQGPAGVVLPGEVARVTNRLALLLGPSGMAQLRGTLAAAVEIPDGDVPRLVRLAEALSRLLDEDAPGQLPGELDREVAQDLQGITGSARSVLAPPSRQADHHRQEEADLRAHAGAAADRVFVAGQRDVVTRTPPDEVRTSARVLAAALRRAAQRLPEPTRVPSPVPPGRGRLSELMRRDAQVVAHTRVTAMPWQQLRRRPQEEPRLVVGVSWDVSGSRRSIHQEMSELTWALSWAVRRIGGDVAAVAWNNRPAPIVHPGLVPEAIVEPACGGGSAGCPESLRALDGALQLASTASGLRVVLASSDGRVPNRRAVTAQVLHLVEHGVHVLWLTPSADDWCPSGGQRVVAPPGQALDVLGARITGLLAEA